MRRALAVIACVVVYVLIIGLIVARRCAAQQPDTLVVEVRLATTGARMPTLAVLDSDSTLRMAAEPVFALLGLGTPTAPWLSPSEVARIGGTGVRAVFDPLTMLVVVFDPFTALPASRAAQSSVIQSLQSATTIAAPSQPWIALTADDSSHGMLEAGFAYRGRLAVAGRIDRTRTTTAAVSLVPLRGLFLSVAKPSDGKPTTSARVSLGPLWVSSDYVVGSPHATNVQGSARIGRLTAFSNSSFGVLTLQWPELTAISVAHQFTGTRTTAARVAIGSVWASPFSFPVTTLSTPSKR